APVLGGATREARTATAHADVAAPADGRTPPNLGRSNPRSSNGQRDFLPVRTCRDNLQSQQLKDPRRFCLPWIQTPRRSSSIVYSWVSVMKAVIAEAVLPKQ